MRCQAVNANPTPCSGVVSLTKLQPPTEPSVRSCSERVGALAQTTALLRAVRSRPQPQAQALCVARLWTPCWCPPALCSCSIQRHTRTVCTWQEQAVGATLAQQSPAECNGCIIVWISTVLRKRLPNSWWHRQSPPVRAGKPGVLGFCCASHNRSPKPFQLQSGHAIKPSCSCGVAVQAGCCQGSVIRVFCPTVTMRAAAKQRQHG